MCHFSHCFQEFFYIFVFRSFIMMCLPAFWWGSCILFEVYSPFWICRLVSFAKFGKFNPLFLPIRYSPTYFLSFWDFKETNVGYFVIVPKAPKTLLIFFQSNSLLFRLGEFYCFHIYGFHSLSFLLYYWIHLLSFFFYSIIVLFMFIFLFHIFYKFHVFAEIFFVFVFVFHSFQELKTESKLARTGINPELAEAQKEGSEIKESEEEISKWGGNARENQNPAKMKRQMQRKQWPQINSLDRNTKVSFSRVSINFLFNKLCFLETNTVEHQPLLRYYAGVVFHKEPRVDYRSCRSSRRCGPVPTMMCSSTIRTWVFSLVKLNNTLSTGFQWKSKDMVSVTSFFLMYQVIFNTTQCTWDFGGGFCFFASVHLIFQPVVRVGCHFQHYLYPFTGGWPPGICLLVLPRRVNIDLGPFTFPN